MHLVFRTVLSRTKFFIRFNSVSILTEIKMGDGKPKRVLLSDVVEKLEDFASTKLAESWDNTGLLVDPMVQVPIARILLTNDLTEEVMAEAVELKVGMIVTYHPFIFKGLVSLTSRTWQERVAISCLKNSIAVFSPHTSWDVVDGGVNDWLAAAFSHKISEPLTLTGAGRLCHLTEPLSVRNAIEKIKSHIGIPHLRLALAVGQTQDSTISTVAVCAGSGASVLTGVRADLYLTGEMLHHNVLEAVHNGSHVVLCNHSDSERGFLKSFATILENKLDGAVKVFVSQKDSDPLKTV